MRMKMELARVGEVSLGAQRGSSGDGHGTVFGVPGWVRVPG
jgi:hypothetical protein